MAKDYYKILGVEKSATQDEIKKAFRKKAHEFHPDKQGGDEAKFKEASEAYQILGNEQKRKQFDQFGTTFDGAQAGAGGFNWSDFSKQGGFGAQGYSNAGFGFEDLGDIFGDFFGGARGQTRARSRRGADIEARITITLEDAVFGVEKNLEVEKQISCDKCKGSGAEAGTKIKECGVCRGSGQLNKTQSTFFGTFNTAVVCDNCDGEGKIPEKVCQKCHGKGVIRGNEKIKVNIPAGIDNGESLRVTGKGEAGEKGATTGDLYIVIRVLPHAEFRREGDNLLTSKKISFSQASLGDKIKLQTLDGAVNLKVPAGTPSGKKFIIKDKGSNKLRSRGRGDLIVEIKVEVPEKLTREQKRLLEELAKEGL